MQGEGEQEYEDYQAECQAEAQGEYEAQMSAEAENEANIHNEEIRAQEEFELEKLTNLSKAIKDLEGVKIDINIIKQHIHPLREWLDFILLKEVKNGIKK